MLCVGASWSDGRKVFLRLSTASRESSESCLEVRRELVERGIQTPVPLTTDGAGGLTKAVEASWPKSRRRCWFHPRQDLQQKVPPPAWPEFKARVIDRRDAPPLGAAEQRRQAMLTRYQRDFPQARRCVLDDAQASLNHLPAPQRPQQYVRTSNWAERAGEEERRRTQVIPHLGRKRA